MKPEGEVRRYQSGALPFTVEACIDTYDGPGWVRRQLRGRSGWLQVSSARLTTDISDWSATLLAAITDDGVQLGKTASRAFLAMSTSAPQTCFDDPPQELSDLTEMLFWDFLGGCDLEHLAMLERAEADLEERIAADEARGDAVLAEAEQHIAALGRRRRAPDTAETERAAIAERIALIEERHRAASVWLVEHLARLRAEKDDFEADVMAALENHGEYEERYTVHWVARSRYDRLVDRSLLAELTRTASLPGVPRLERLTQQDRWEIAEAKNPRPANRMMIEPTRRRDAKPARKSCLETTKDGWARERQELDAALEDWRAKKSAQNGQAVVDPEPSSMDFAAIPEQTQAAIRPGAASGDELTDVGVLIESGLAELLKDLRRQ